MIISHKFRFVFVKTAKTAGTSIETYLSTHCGRNDVLTPIIPPVSPHSPRNHEGYYNHIPGHEIRAKISPSVWKTYFKFCVERNPWDKTLSHFYMERAREGNALTFDHYLERRSFPINFPMYTEPSDQSVVIVDEILRYESLAGDLSRVFARLGVPFNGMLDVTAKSEYRTDRRPYREVYTAEQAELIREAFAREILLHGYTF